MLLVLVLLISLASAAPAPWTKSSRAFPHAMHSVSLFVRYRDGALQQCDNLLQETSADPKNPRFGYEYSESEVASLFRNTESEAVVMKHLSVSGFQKLQILSSPKGEFIKLAGTVAQIEKAFGARMHYYIQGDRRVIRDTSFKIPSHLRKHISHVTNMKDLPSLTRRMQEPSAAPASKRQNQNDQVTPQLIASFYNIQNNNVSTAAANVAVFEAGGPGGLNFNPADLTAYQQKWQIPQVPVTSFIGPNDASVCANDATCQSSFNACGEPTLDVQTVFAVAQNANMTYWSIQAANTGMFLSYAEAVAAESNPPKVHSISYGFATELDPIDDVLQFETFACQLALRRITILVASGDDGVNSRNACQEQQCDTMFTPTYPAVSAYVVAVGATQGPESGTAEVVCASKTGGLITSGGGFSEVIPQPGFQAQAVKNYLSGPNVPDSQYFNASGRAYPDIAALGHNFPVLITSETCVGSGTSASCPLVAGMITLVNGMRIANGKGAIGWVNPHLYNLAAQGSQYFNDITEGNNACCAGQQAPFFCCNGGYAAVPGFDPVSGLGSPNFENLGPALAAM